MDATPPTIDPMAQAADRLAHCTETLRALAVIRWCEEWPRGHRDRPAIPAHVRAWEAKHGRAPASAHRFLEGIAANT